MQDQLPWHQARNRSAPQRKPTKKAPTIEDVNNMAAARSAAVVLLNELADDSAILETTSCDDQQ